LYKLGPRCQYPVPIVYLFPRYLFLPDQPITELRVVQQKFEIECEDSFVICGDHVSIFCASFLFTFSLEMSHLLERSVCSARDGVKVPSQV
jgi:hypothetical protein